MLEQGWRKFKVLISHISNQKLAGPLRAVIHEGGLFVLPQTRSYLQRFT